MSTYVDLRADDLHPVQVLRPVDVEPRRAAVGAVAGGGSSPGCRSVRATERFEEAGIVAYRTPPCASPSTSTRRCTTTGTARDVAARRFGVALPYEEQVTGTIDAAAARAAAGLLRRDPHREADPRRRALSGAVEVVAAGTPPGTSSTSPRTAPTARTTRRRPGWSASACPTTSSTAPTTSHRCGEIGIDVLIDDSPVTSLRALDARHRRRHARCIPGTARYAERTASSAPTTGPAWQRALAAASPPADERSGSDATPLRVAAVESPILRARTLVKSSAFIVATLVLARLLAGAGRRLRLRLAARDTHRRGRDRRRRRRRRHGARRRRARRSSARCSSRCAGPSSPAGKRQFTLTPDAGEASARRRQGSADAALHALARGQRLLAHVPRGHRRGARREGRRRRHVDSRAAVKRVVRRAQRATRPQGVDAERRPLDGGRSTRRVLARGCQLRARTLREDARAPRCRAAASRAPCAVEARTLEPKVTTADLAKKYPAILIINRVGVPADALQGPQAGQDLRHRGRPGRPGDPGRALQHPEQGGQPRLARARHPTGRASWPAR